MSTKQVVNGVRCNFNESRANDGTLGVVRTDGALRQAVASFDFDQLPEARADDATVLTFPAGTYIERALFVPSVDFVGAAPVTATVTVEFVDNVGTYLLNGDFSALVAAGVEATDSITVDGSVGNDGTFTVVSISPTQISVTEVVTNEAAVEVQVGYTPVNAVSVSLVDDGGTEVAALVAVANGAEDLTRGVWVVGGGAGVGAVTTDDSQLVVNLGIAASAGVGQVVIDYYLPA